MHSLTAASLVTNVNDARLLIFCFLFLYLVSLVVGVFLLPRLRPKTCGNRTLLGNKKTHGPMGHKGETKWATTANITWGRGWSGS